jgi:steroid 5-alpha reductase family enzyme
MSKLGKLLIILFICSILFVLMVAFLMVGLMNQDVVVSGVAMIGLMLTLVGLSIGASVVLGEYEYRSL